MSIDIKFENKIITFMKSKVSGDDFELVFKTTAKLLKTNNYNDLVAIILAIAKNHHPMFSTLVTTTICIYWPLRPS